MPKNMHSLIGMTRLQHLARIVARNHAGKIAMETANMFVTIIA